MSRRRCPTLRQGTGFSSPAAGPRVQDCEQFTLFEARPSRSRVSRLNFAKMHRPIRVPDVPERLVRCDLHRCGPSGCDVRASLFMGAVRPSSELLVRRTTSVHVSKTATSLMADLEMQYAEDGDWIGRPARLLFTESSSRTHGRPRIRDRSPWGVRMFDTDRRVMAA